MSRLQVRNARVVTRDAAQPIATGFDVAGGRVEHLYFEEPPTGSGSVLDCKGAVIYPGFIDAHCHPAALGARAEQVDCSPANASSIAEIQRLLQAAKPDASGWIRAWGYDELRLPERRHPTRHDLDAAVAERPVILTHGSGHAVVLNSAALQVAGITATTDEPPGGTIDRDPHTGEPTGLLLEMPGFLRQRHPPSPTSRAVHLKRATDLLLASGVTAVTDASHLNGAEELNTYVELSQRGEFPPKTTVMLGPGERRGDALQTDLVVEGATKLMLSTSFGKLNLTVTELVELAAEATALGAPGIAIHAVEEEAVLAAAEACGLINKKAGVTGFVTRIEHASEAAPHVIDAIKRSGAIVVTQPGFIRSRGERYLIAEDLGGYPSSDLYPLRSLLDVGVPVAAGNDAPYGPHGPLEVVAAAVDRLTDAGNAVGPEQTISISEALDLFGPAAAAVSGHPDVTGTLTPGGAADFVLLSDDPAVVPVDRIAEIEVIATYIAGRQVWSERKT